MIYKVAEKTQGRNLARASFDMNSFFIKAKLSCSLSVGVYSSECQNIISCRKFWHGAKTLAQNFGKENLPKLLAWNFMPKFRAEIRIQNTSTVPKLLAQNFGIKNLPEFSA